MDPNALLQRLLMNCRKLRIFFDAPDPALAIAEAIEDGVAEDMDQIVTDVENLDEWLHAKRGFLPDRWNHSRNRNKSQEGWAATVSNLTDDDEVIESSVHHCFVLMFPLSLESVIDSLNRGLDIHYTDGDVRAVACIHVTRVESLVEMGQSIGVVITGFRNVDEDLWVKQRWSIITK